MFCLDRTFNTVPILAESDPYIFVYRRNNPPNPKTPNPTTLKPITEPPLKATLKASSKDSRAALVVRLFDLVATLIPRNPAKPDAIAPIRNDNAINALESELSLFAIPRIIATATTKTAKTRYSALKNAIAPSAILAPMTRIFSVPWP